MIHLHFTFGPVQAFVAQARRTRDLYAGSFLLSHLAMAAMKAAEDSGGKIILPDFKNIQQHINGLPPDKKHALAPNRFEAAFADAETAALGGKQAANALQTAWRKIANTVWEAFLEPLSSHGDGTREIWDRQIGSFWEIAWAVGAEGQNDLLDRRKNWRTPPMSIEQGAHCSLMGNWQELSGFIRSTDQRKQKNFWESVCERASHLDLEADERLCAIAFVKRFFPVLPKDKLKEALGYELEMRNWPSTVSLAAIPWQRKIKENSAFHQAAKEYAELAKGCQNATINKNRLKLLREFPPDAGEFSRLSGNFLIRAALENPRATPLPANGQDDPKRRKELLDSLRALEELTGDRAGNFYAVLLMDGDSMGQLIREKGGETVAKALIDFSKAAPQIIADHDGITVYAGGDDLLALLPLDRALAAATAARSLYQESFKGTPATISAAIVFAHYKNAFSRVLRLAHHLLDDVAKDRTGRDAIAISVLKPGDESCQWSAKFGNASGGQEWGANPAELEALIKNAKALNAASQEQNKESDELPLSNSFLYNLRERFSALGEIDTGNDGAIAISGDLLDNHAKKLAELFSAEHLHAHIDKKNPEKAEKQRKASLSLMTKLIETGLDPGGKKFTFDGIRLLKFLIMDGKEGNV